MFYKKILCVSCFFINILRIDTTCQNSCGFKAKDPFICYCDKACYYHNDCCMDICICNFTDTICELPPSVPPLPPLRPSKNCIDTELNLDELFSEYLNYDKVDCEIFIWFIGLTTNKYNEIDVCSIELSEVYEIFYNVFENNYIWLMPGSPNDIISNICPKTCYNYGVDINECNFPPPHSPLSSPPPPPPPSPPPPPLEAVVVIE